MAKKKITIAAGANPFDKSVSAAEQMFAPPPLRQRSVPLSVNSTFILYCQTGRLTS